MKPLKVKIALAIVLLLSFAFFSNDFSLIDIKKTAIITAIAIDYDQEKLQNDEQYTVTVQVAVPEATDVNTESSHSEISASAGTVGSAIKKIGDRSGWFPHLSFCNLILLGQDLAEKTNVIQVLDYFSETLRIQDSAMVATTKGKAKDFISQSTSLDKISSFALQRILFKNPGFDTDVAVNNIKDFCLQYYDDAHSSFMPIISKIDQKSDNNGENGGSGSSESSEGTSSGGSNGQQIGNGSESGSTTIFLANTTALFNQGIQVGELNKKNTLVFNGLKEDISGTTLEVDEVKIGLGEKFNYLLTIIKNRPNISFEIDKETFKIKIDLDLYCKLSDKNTKYSNTSMTKNTPIPDEVLQKAQKDISEEIVSLLQTIRRTGCDFLNVKQKLYRDYYNFYPQYKDNYLEKMQEEINVYVHGQASN